MSLHHQCKAWSLASFAIARARMRTLPAAAAAAAAARGRDPQLHVVLNRADIDLVFLLDEVAASA